MAIDKEKYGSLRLAFALFGRLAKQSQDSLEAILDDKPWGEIDREKLRCVSVHLGIVLSRTREEGLGQGEQLRDQIRSLEEEINLFLFQLS